MSDGKRRITHVTEITGMAGDVVSMQDIFVFEKTGIDPPGRVSGLRATGVSPKFAEKLKTSGILLSPSVFEHVVEVYIKAQSMSLITVFVILLVAAFATAAYFTEPSAAEKRIRERMAELSDSTEASDDAIVREVTFSSIAQG